MTSEEVTASFRALYNSEPLLLLVDICSSGRAQLYTGKSSELWPQLDSEAGSQLFGRRGVTNDTWPVITTSYLTAVRER